MYGKQGYQPCSAGQRENKQPNKAPVLPNQGKGYFLSNEYLW